MEQYNALLKVIPELNEKLRSQGHGVGDASAAGVRDSLAQADKSAKPKKSKRANIDATSDEEEADDE